jgi:uncharacterized caspase-like protein
MPAARALVIATDRYGDASLQRLRGPAKDAEELARTLADPAIGGYEVRTMFNQPTHLVAEEIEAFFADRARDDLLVLYFSCHGVKDDSGRLYFACANTKVQRLAATGLSSVFVSECMDRSRSRKIVLLLDCCYSGAFARGHVARSGETVDVQERFDGRGRVVITASTAMEYAFEVSADADVSGEGTPSLFTGAVLQGLRTGEADLDADGRVSVDELYDYVFGKVQEENSNQTPSMISNIQGDLYLASNPRRPSDVADQDTVASTASGVEASALERVATQAESSGRERLSKGSTIARIRPRWILSAAAMLAVAILVVYLLWPDHRPGAGQAVGPSTSTNSAQTAAGTRSPIPSSGTVTLADQTLGLDLVSGELVPFTQSSLSWNGVTGKLFVFDETTFGAVNLMRAAYDAVTLAMLSGLKYGRGLSNPPISGVDLPPGSVIAIHVRDHLFAKVQILKLSVGEGLTLRWATYGAAN